MIITEGNFDKITDFYGDELKSIIERNLSSFEEHYQQNKIKCLWSFVNMIILILIERNYLELKNKKI